MPVYHIIPADEFDRAALAADPVAFCDRFDRAEGDNPEEALERWAEYVNDHGGCDEPPEGVFAVVSEHAHVVWMELDASWYVHFWASSFPGPPEPEPAP